MRELIEFHTIALVIFVLLKLFVPSAATTLPWLIVLLPVFSLAAILMVAVLAAGFVMAVKADNAYHEKMLREQDDQIPAWLDTSFTIPYKRARELTK